MFKNLKIILGISSSLILTLLFNSCGTSSLSLYSFDYPLTTETAKSQSAYLSVKIPQGWFTAEDNQNNYIDLWLIKDDYSANLQFTLMNVDSLTRKEIGSKGLDILAELSTDFKLARYGKTLGSITNQETFEINNIRFFAYQYLDENKKNIRVVVFQKENIFYELTAIPNKTNNISGLFRIQNSILSSIN